MGIKSPSRLQSRIAALEVLLVVYQGTSLKNALEHNSFTTIPTASKGYARFLVTQTIRYQRVLKQIMFQYLTKKPQKKSLDFVYALLTLGICELLLSQQKPNITLSCFVDIVKNDRKHSHLSGMIRAILGKVLAEKDKLSGLLVDYPKVFGTDLYNKIHSDYGTQTDMICRWLLTEPTVDILKLTDCPTPEAYQELSSICARMQSDAVRPEKLGIFTDGDITIQSFSSHLPLYCAGDIKGKTIIDLCAAPGGKTLQAVSSGAKVTSVDISERRLEKLKENLERTGLEATIITSDVLDLELSDKFDIVLLDAPCSATGTIRKNPDIIYHYNPKTTKDLEDLQQRLLNKAKDLLNDDGLLIYAICSLSNSEGEEQIQNFLTENPDFMLVNPVRTEILLKEALTPQGYIRLLPHHDTENAGHDGFFVAYLKKTSGGKYDSKTEIE